MKRRGRPRNADSREISRQDETIARAVSQLVFWGFPQRRRRGGVYQEVAIAAARVLKRIDGEDLPLSADRVEQIYEAWRDRQPEPNFAKTRARYSKGSLQARRPDKIANLEELALRLVASAAQWPCALDEEFISCGDHDLTPKAHADYLSRIVPIKTG